MSKLAPHPDLPQYYRDSATRQGEVDTMFDNAAVDYDRITQVMSFGSGNWYRKDVLKRLGVVAGSRVMDIGAGTGAVTLPLQELTGEEGLVLGVDPSRNMLGQGVVNGIENPVRGVGEALPFAEASFDFVTMGYALRHVPDLHAAFTEYLRVLRPGGRVLLLEISRPSNQLGLAALRFYMRHVVPPISGFFSQGRHSKKLMEYYWDTIEACVPPEGVLAALTSAGFAEVERNVLFGTFSEYTATRPE